MQQSTSVFNEVDHVDGQGAVAVGPGVKAMWQGSYFSQEKKFFSHVLLIKKDIKCNILDCLFWLIFFKQHV